MAEIVNSQNVEVTKTKSEPVVPPKPIKVKHKVNGQTFTVSKAYYDEHKEVLSVVK